MSARIVGNFHFDPDELRLVVNRVSSMSGIPAYDAYALGRWETIPLWNCAGDAAQGESIEYDHPAQPTQVGRALSYLSDVLNAVFVTEHIRSVRIFRAPQNALIMPHRDYLEHKRGFTRLHMPLQVDDSSLNSEEHIVFRMRPDEIWFIDGHRVHSGGSFSKLDRLLLVVDFDPAVPIPQLFRRREYAVPTSEPTLIVRPPLEETLIEHLLGFAGIVNASNLRDVVAILARVHFANNTSAATMFDWLDLIAQRSGDHFLIGHSELIRRFFILDGPGKTPNPWTY